MKKLILLLILVSNSLQAYEFDSYVSLNSKNKQQVLWEQVVDSEYSELPNDNNGGWAKAIKFMTLFSLHKSFTHCSDVMPEGRKKMIHPYGSVAKVDFIANPNSPFTGLFKGAKGLIRLGYGAPPKDGKHVPGMAIKLFVDGRPSKNMHVMYSLDGQGPNTNFFENNFTNIIPSPKSRVLRILKRIFDRYVDNSTHLKVKHVSRFTSDGNRVLNPKAPYKIIFVPQISLSKRSKLDIREEFQTIASGTLLYRVYGQLEYNNQFVDMGKLVTTSKFIASSFGDEKLFFKHSDDFLKDWFKSRAAACE